MSTNYYLMTKDKALVDRCFPNEYTIVDCPYFGYEIHIGKRSGGWKPLFEAHKAAYSSVEEMLEFLRTHEEISIFDEYEREFTIEGLKNELVDWAEHQEKRIIHYSDEIGDIETPIDHCEIKKRDKSGRYSFVKYWHDHDGYDFTDSNFS